MTVTVPERDELASGIAERKLNELSGSELVRNHKPGNGCHAAASLNDAAHGLVGPQFHHNVEASGIDATLSQSVLKYLAGTRAFLAQHPPSRQQMVEFDRVGLRELVRRPDHHNELIDSYRNRTRSGSSTSPSTKPRSASPLRTARATCSELPMFNSIVTPGWMAWKS